MDTPRDPFLNIRRLSPQLKCRREYALLRGPARASRCLAGRNEIQTLPASPKSASLCASRTPVPSLAQAAVPTDKLAEQSCARIDGWLLWTGYQDLWNAMSDGGVIDQALSPKTRPDPCG